MKLCLLGATGTIGHAVARELVRRGHDLVCLVRPRGAAASVMAGADVRVVDMADSASIARDGLRGERFDAVVSCMASRTGAPEDAWSVDHDAHAAVLTAAQAGGIGRWVQLSAICVQKPLLAFQHAKLAFEERLQASGLAWTIVRPTAFFKSLSGQIARVQAGKPFLMFGHGRLNACAPISDEDLAAFIADCLTDPASAGRILPIGGPGPALTPRDQGELLFAALGKPARFASAPAWLLDVVIAVLSTLGHVAPALKDKAELARIGRYYATESMLVLDPATGAYSDAATPRFGTRTLADHYADVIAGRTRADLGDHAVF
jgi:divinyl chlorophyllide a 8-vinyl-reductase